MSNTKARTERRLQKRFKVEQGVFAALADQGSPLGQIKDISRRGLSFYYIDNEEPSDGACELKIILGNRGLYLDKVPIKKITDFEIESEFRFSVIKMRQIGLQFGELTHEQLARLDKFIQKHTIGEV
jgi:hypothetical protein